MIDIVYFGTSEHSVILLNSFKTSAIINLKLVITKPDRPVGRKQELLPSPVKKWCIENNIPYVTPASLKKEKQQVLEALQDTHVKVGVVADYGLMIPKEHINYFEKGLINIHFSLLPKLRGASPVTYALLQGLETTGITFLLTTPEMDKGDILKQIEVEIENHHNDQSLYQKLFKIAGEQAPEIINRYMSGDLTLIPQNETEATYATPSGKFDRTTYILKEDAKIDWTQSPQQIERAIRAYYPWPVAWSTLEELAKYLNKELKNKDIKNLKIKVHTAHIDSNNNLSIDTIQVEGKTIISFEDFIRGYFA